MQQIGVAFDLEAAMNKKSEPQSARKPPAEEPDTADRKTYTPPELSYIGSVRDLTLGSGGTVPDGFGNTLHA